MNSRDQEDCARLPIFRIEYAESADCTPMICGLARELRRRGLRVAIAVLPGHHLAADLPETGVNQLFAAGCDLISLGTGRMRLSHENVTPGNTLEYLRGLCQAYDIVLVDGETVFDLPVFRLQQKTGSENRLREAGRLIHLLDCTREISLCGHSVVDLLGEITTRMPVWACVLIGGRSSRMGRAKHLLTAPGGLTWLERTVGVLQPFAEQVVLAGGGQVPDSLQGLIRLPDIPGVAGPLTGILSAMRWQPDVSWLLVACDMPSLCPEALAWLINSRRPGIWGTVPKRSPESHVEPLLAHYDSRCRSLFESVLASGSHRIGDVARQKKIATPIIPVQLIAAWDNINTPEELRLNAL